MEGNSQKGEGAPKAKSIRHGLEVALRRLRRGRDTDLPQDVLDTIVRAALDGDMKAAKFILERIHPVPKAKDVVCVEGLPDAPLDRAQAVQRLVFKGEIDIANGKTLIDNDMKLHEAIDVKRQMEELQQRLDRIEYGDMV